MPTRTMEPIERTAPSSLGVFVADMLLSESQPTPREAREMSEEEFALFMAVSQIPFVSHSQGVMVPDLVRS